MKFNIPLNCFDSNFTLPEHILYNLIYSGMYRYRNISSSQYEYEVMIISSINEI